MKKLSKTKKKRTLSKGLENTITARVRAAMEDKGWNISDLSRESGVDDGALSKMFRGEDRLWNLDILEKIARPLFGVSNPAGFFREPVKVPVVAEISNNEGPAQESILNPHPLEYRSYSMEVGNEMALAQLYSFRVKDRSMMPAFPPGTILTAQRDTWRHIAHENFVVFWQEDGGTSIRQVLLPVGSHLVLRCLSQSIPDMILPKEHIKMCDRILRVEYPGM